MDLTGKQRWAVQLAHGPWPYLLAAAGLCACSAVLGIEEATLDPSVGGHANGGSGGTSAECQVPLDCNDYNPCTTDDCAAGSCGYSNVTNGPAPADLQTAGDCKQVMCTNGAQHSQNDDADLPTNESQCTDPACSNGAPSNPPKADGTTCNENGGKVCYLGDCKECYDNAQCTGNDTCGGAGTPYECGCRPTACDALTCGFANDTKCGGGAISCNNNQQDGNETDVDCGGPQPPAGTCSLLCVDGKNCTVNTDCQHGQCAQPCGICGTGCGGAGGAAGAGGTGGTGGS